MRYPVPSSVLKDQILLSFAGSPIDSPIETLIKDTGLWATDEAARIEREF